VGFVLVRVADGVVFGSAVAGLAGRDPLCVGFTVAATVGVTLTAIRSASVSPSPPPLA
jgi:hypothetical protein